ncbi:MAG TPA: Hpt domain-containing protein [Spongiibacteraceae bacterium]
MTVERRDYIALEWVAGEITETLTQSAAALEEFLQNRDDVTRLRFCLTYIHQVYGTLKMVEFAGAALLAEEMEEVVQGLLSHKINESQREDALLALKAALTKLPGYLQQLLAQRRDAPAALLPMLNDLRAVRGEALITESAVFTPEIPRATTAKKMPVNNDGDLPEVAKKLRQMYQMALLNYLRNHEPRENLNYLAKVCARLAKLAAGQPPEALWKVCIALFEGLLNRSIQPTAAVKTLLRQVDSQLKLFAEQGAAALALDPPEALLKNLLYYIAASGANSRYIGEIKQTYNLTQALPDAAQFIDDAGAEAAQSIKAALAQQLAAIADDLVHGAGTAALLAEVKRAQDTTALLGMNNAQISLRTLAQQLQNNSVDIDNSARTLRQLAEGLELGQRPQIPRPLFNDSEEAQEQLDKAFDAVMRESRNSLEQAKEAIIEFVATQWRHQSLEDVPELLAGVRGSFAVAGLHRAAAVLAACENYVRKDLLEERKIPAWQLLDTLADAIASVDYYLERLSEDADAECESILAVAEQSVTVLISTPSSTVAPPPLISAQVLPFLRPGTAQEDEIRIHDNSEFAADDIDESIHFIESSDTEENRAQNYQQENLEEKINQLEDADASAANEETSVAPVANVTSTDDDIADAEIVEIFIEEAGEVLDTIHEYLPQWAEHPSDAETLTVIRRAFHTLKGSGRMVGAIEIGELTWSIENMLNRVIDGTVFIDTKRLDTIAAAVALVPRMVQAFQQHLPAPMTAAQAIIERSFALAKEQSPELPPLASCEVATDSSEVSADVTAERARAQTTVEPPADFSAPLGEAEENDALLDIFANEANTHIQAVEDFIAHAEQLAGPPVLSDDLQRALHTLKGSAHMADVGPMAQVVTPLEHLIKELRTAQIKADRDVMAALRQGAQLFRAGLAQLAIDPHRALPGAEEFVEWVEMLYHTHLAQFEDDHEPPIDTISPAALNHFLADSIELISAVSDDLNLWRQQRLDDERQHTLAATISQVADSAEILNLSPVVDLAQALQALLRQGADRRVDDRFFDVAGRGADALIDMLDRLAANQQPQTETELLNALQDFEFGAESAWQAFDIPVLDDVVEATAIESNFEIPDEFNADNKIAFELQHESSFTATVDENNAFFAAPAEAIELDAADLGIEEYTDSGFAAFNDFAAEISAPESPSANAEAVLAVDAKTTIDVNENDSFELESDAIAPQAIIDDGEFVFDEAEFADAEDEQPITELVFSSELEADDAELIDFGAEAVNEIIDETAVDAADTADIAPQSADSTADSDTAPEPKVVAAQPFAATPSRDFQFSDDEEIDAEILEIFLEEAGDLLEAIDEAIHNWTDDRGNSFYLDDLQRLLHTLKGGARLAGLKNLGNLSHNFETLLINAQQQGRAVDDPFLNEVQIYQDQLMHLVSAVKAHGHGADQALNDAAETAQPSAAELQATTESGETESKADTASGEDSDTSASITAKVQVPAQTSARRPEPNVIPFVRPEPAPFQVPATRETEDLPEVGGVAQQLRRGPQEVIKISAQLIEQLVNLAGETSIARSRSEEQVNEFVFSLDEMQITVDRLHEQVRRLDLETEAQMLFRQEQVESVGLEGFDPLEFDRYSLLQQLSRSLLESASDLIDIKNTLSEKARDMETLLVQQSRINTELQEGLMRSRMVQFARMVPRLRRIVRQVAGELDKQVDFFVDNAEGELDRTVLERVVAPLEHMLRNAIDHGIEPVNERVTTGKSPQGTVVLSLGREGSEIVMTLADDGRGVDLEAVRAKAIDRGLMAPGANLTDHEIMQFILQSGFSTAKQVTQISGRGVGMDVVYSEIKQLGGTVEIDSAWGQGTRFTIRLPFTVSVNRALMVSVAGDIYAIPLNSIEGIVRVSPFELEAYYQPEAPLFEYAGQPYLMRYMGALLRTGDKPNLEGVTMPLPVLLVRGSDHAVAVQVDGLMGSREIVVKTLGPQFGLVQGLSGATVLGDGSVVVILDLLAMIRADASQLHRDLLLGQEEITFERSRPLLVMVVDDSVTVRKVTSRFLERQGMEVVLAKDGVDAISLLQEMEQIPDVMLLDIEMPRMDGFEVASRIRHTSRLQEIPIIMITSRTGEKHRERAFSLGVNRYLGKPYQEMMLLDTIHELTGTTAPV